MQVLIVEPQIDRGEEIQHTLNKMGHSVILCDGFCRARTWLECRPFDFVLLNIACDRGEGVLFVRDAAREHTISCIGFADFLNGHGEHKAKRAGCIAHLIDPTQPVAVESVIGKVYRMLANR